MNEELKAKQGESDEEREKEVTETNAAQAEKTARAETDAKMDEVSGLHQQDVKGLAVSKLKEAEKKAGPTVKLIIEHLLKRCEESEALCSDIAKEAKTWGKCFTFIKEKARNQAEGSCAMVRDDDVFEWAEDYFHMDNAEKEKLLEKNVPAKVSAGKNPDPKNTQAKNHPKTKAASKAEEKKPSPQPRKKSKEIEGQMDIFTMFGLQEA